MSEFSDGFGVADAIRRDHPEEWEVLTGTNLLTQDVGEEDDVAGGGRFSKVNEFPVIQ